MPPAHTRAPAIAVFMLTCPERRAVRRATLRAWARTDWAHRPPALQCDPAPGPASLARMCANARLLLTHALATRAGLFLLLEDDLRFHPRLRRHLAAWPALRAPDFALGSLCNLGLAAAAVRPAERSVHIAPGCYIGGQALVLTRAPSPRPAWRSGSKSTAVPNCASPPSPPGAAPSGCMRPPWSPMPAPPAPGAAATMPPPTSIPRGSRPRRAKPGAAHPPEPCAAAQG